MRGYCDLLGSDAWRPVDHANRSTVLPADHRRGPKDARAGRRDAGARTGRCRQGPSLSRQSRSNRLPALSARSRRRGRRQHRQFATLVRLSALRPSLVRRAQESRLARPALPLIRPPPQKAGKGLGCWPTWRQKRAQEEMVTGVLDTVVVQILPPSSTEVTRLTWSEFRLSLCQQLESPLDR